MSADPAPDDIVGGPFSYQGNDPEYNLLNALRHMNFDDSWAIEGGTDNVLVAIFDTGLDWFHPDLVNNIFVNPGEMNGSTTVNFTNGTITGDGIDNDGNGYVDDLVGWDFRLNRNDPNHVVNEISGVHGTQVSGPFAVPDNGYGFAGMAPNVQIVGCKVNSANLGGWVTNSILAIDYAISIGVDIINHSYGTNTWQYSTIWHQAIQQATDNFNVLFIGLAHNYNSTTPVYPSGWDEVMAVAATLLDDTKLPLSNYGTWIDVSATVEDVGILSFDPSAGTHSTTLWTGATSSASPIACAVAALIKSVNNNFTPQQIRDFITETADDIDAVNPSYVGLLGSGRINAHNAVNVATGAPAKPRNLHYTSVDNHPNLIWDSNTEANLSGYKIYRSYDGSAFSLRTTVSSTTTNFTDTQVDFTKPIWAKEVLYKIRAYNTSTQYSIYSDELETEGIIDLPKKNTVENIKAEFSLEQNFPNPFNPTTIINYNLPQNGFVTLKVYDVLGKEIANLVNETKEAGSYSVEFNASNLPSGVYFYKITAGNFSEIKKMILTK